MDGVLGDVSLFGLGLEFHFEDFVVREVASLCVPEQFLSLTVVTGSAHELFHGWINCTSLLEVLSVLKVVCAALRFVTEGSHLDLAVHFLFVNARFIDNLIDVAWLDIGSMIRID